jgi:segregation and condensation protein B
MNEYKKPVYFFDDVSMGKNYLKTCIEGILFIAPIPIKLRSICEVLDIDKETALKIIKELKDEYLNKERGFVLREVGDGYRLYSNPSIADVLKNFACSNIRFYLTRAALETLAIILYRQPVTRTQIAEIRGVKTDSIVLNLVSKGLVREAGRLKEPGNPVIYKTTDKFLEILGLNDLKDLPDLEDFDSFNNND